MLVTSPEILVFLFFMITDPRTIPRARSGRRAYAVAVGLLAALLIAPWTTEFSTKVAVLGALALVCAARVPLVVALPSERATRALERLHRPASRCRSPASALLPSRRRAARRSPGCPARPEAAEAAPAPVAAKVPDGHRRRDAAGVRRIGEARGTTIAAALVADLEQADEALRTRDGARAETAATGAGSPSSGRRSSAAGARDRGSRRTTLERVRLRLEPRRRARGRRSSSRRSTGTSWTTTYEAAPAARSRADRAAVVGTDVRARRAGRAVPDRRRARRARSRDPGRAPRRRSR